MDPVEKLQTLLRIRTVADPDPALTDPAPFEEFRDTFVRLFPLLAERLERVDVAPYGMLWRWPGLHADAEPVVLMAHIDVVPVQAEDPWTHDAWAASIVDGAVWGRGTLDDKGQLVAIAQAVEELLAEGVTPARDVWLSFGSDEEVFGACARNAVEHLREAGVRPWFVLDEGGAVASDAFPGISRPLAVIGTTEKGVATLQLRVEGRGGHASTPRRLEPAARLARAILRIDQRPFPGRLPTPTLELFRRLTPHAPLPLRPLLAGAARLGPALVRTLQAVGPETAAMTRTTAVTTTLSGAPAHNVIPASATASVNIRILTGDSLDSVVDHITRAVNDREVTISMLEGSEPSPVSPVDDDAFRLLESTVAEVFVDAVVTPYVMMAATDSRHFTEISERVYRFAPFRMSKAQRQAIHSYDEHLGVSDFHDGIRWYRRLIERLPQ